MSNNWSQFMQNPKGAVLKKFMSQVLGNKVNPYDEVITRLSTVLITDNDIKVFGEMINDVMVLGYRKAVEDYQTQLNKMGIEVSLISKD